MSEQAKDVKEEKKKKGKLPVIVALVLALAAGGFFGMKMKGGGPKKPDPIKLGAVEKLGEFLLNLEGNSVYLRTEISLHLKDGFKKEELEKNVDAIKDAVIQVLSTKSLAETSARNRTELKREIAAAINEAIESNSPPADHKGEAGKDKAPHDEGDKKDKEKEKIPEHDDWDSQTGPVLKVYFTSFATQ